MDWIREENYAEEMRAKVEPYVAARKESGSFERVPGQRIYYEHFRAEAPKGVIVISHGFTESVQKFTESIYYMLRSGYEVWGFDHRGHGRSVRLNDNPYVVHVERFRDYVEDLHHLVETLVKPAAHELPLYLYCHSMGGCVGAKVIEQYPELFDKAVLSSPMLGLSFGNVPVHAVYIGASLMGIGERRKNSPTPVNEFDTTPHFETSCDSSECRYLYYLEKQKADRHLQREADVFNAGGLADFERLHVELDEAERLGVVDEVHDGEKQRAGCVRLARQDVRACPRPRHEARAVYDRFRRADPVLGEDFRVSSVKTTVSALLTFAFHRNLDDIM